MRHLACVLAVLLLATLPACAPESDEASYTCPNVSCGPPPGPAGGPRCCPAGTNCCFGYNVCCASDKPHLGTDGRCWASIPPDPIGLRTVCGVPAS